MKTFQQSTQNSFKEYVNKLMNSFEAKLDAKAEEIQDSFTISLGVRTAQFEAEQAKRIELAKQMENIKLQIQEGTTPDIQAEDITAQLAKLKSDLMHEISKMNKNQKVTAATTGYSNNVHVVTSAYDSSRRVLIRGPRPASHRETNDDVLVSVIEMLTAINVNVDIESVERKKQRVDTHPGITVVTLKSPGKWIGHNGLNLDSNADRGNEEMGLLAKNKLLDHFTYTVVDKNCEGILWTRFTHKFDNDVQFSICP